MLFFFFLFGNTAPAGLTEGRVHIGNTVVDKEGVIFEGGGNTALTKGNREHELHYLWTGKRKIYEQEKEGNLYEKFILLLYTKPANIFYCVPSGKHVTNFIFSADSPGTFVVVFEIGNPKEFFFCPFLLKFY